MWRQRIVWLGVKQQADENGTTRDINIPRDELREIRVLFAWYEPFCL
jgi:hypothetical protein